MNVTFRLATEELEKAFVKESTAAGFDGLKGHRSVGGMRASIYNAFPEEGIDGLVAFMRDFERATASPPAGGGRAGPPARGGEGSDGVHPKGNRGGGSPPPGGGRPDHEGRAPQRRGEGGIGSPASARLPSCLVPGQ